MMSTQFYRLGVICVVLAALAGASSAQKSANPSQLVKVSLASDAGTLSRQKPGVATVTIENASGREIDLKAICSFELLSMGKQAVARNHSVFGDSYWSPVNVSTGEPLQLNIVDPKLLKKGVVVGRVPEAVLHFTKGEIKTFRLDLTKLLWNADMGNDWPRWNLFEVVPKGAYSLFFEIGSSGDIKSNEVKVSVELTRHNIGMQRSADTTVLMLLSIARRAR